MYDDREMGPRITPCILNSTTARWSSLVVSVIIEILVLTAKVTKTSEATLRGQGIGIDPVRDGKARLTGCIALLRRFCLLLGVCRFFRPRCHPSSTGHFLQIISMWAGFTAKLILQGEKSLENTLFSAMYQRQKRLQLPHPKPEYSIVITKTL